MKDAETYSSRFYAHVTAVRKGTRLLGWAERVVQEAKGVQLDVI